MSNESVDSITLKSDEYAKKSFGLKVLLESSQSARTFIEGGSLYYEFIFDRISEELVKHIAVFGDSVSIKVLGDYTIAVIIEINK